VRVCVCEHARWLSHIGDGETLKDKWEGETTKFIFREGKANKIKIKRHIFDYQQHQYRNVGGKSFVDDECF